MIAVEPSPLMIAKRPEGAAPAMQGVAEALPLDDQSVDAAMGTLTIHHWSDLDAGLAEMRRVARKRIVLLTIDAEKNSEIWTLSEYFPAAAQAEREKMPAMQTLEAQAPQRDDRGRSRAEPLPGRIHQRPLGPARALPRARDACAPARSGTSFPPR